MEELILDYDFKGKTCPYCQFPIKGRAEVITCPVDHIPHHKECWEENGGCTTYGCHATANSGETSANSFFSTNNSSEDESLDIELGGRYGESRLDGNSSSGPVLHESAAGIISFIASIIIALLYLLESDAIADESVLLFSILALFLGLVGLFQKRRKCSYAALGTVFALFLIAVSFNSLQSMTAQVNRPAAPVSSGNILVPEDYSTIQEAIDNASSGEVITVSEGIYKESIDFKGKNITLQSSDPNDPEVVVNTVIDGNNNGTVVAFKNGENDSAKLAGFTITGGSGSREQYRVTSYSGSRLSFDRNYGGGILISGNSSPVIVNNFIVDNRTRNISSDVLGVGAGIAVLDSSSPEIINNTIAGNYSGGHGGGIAVWYEAAPIIANNTIEKNHADDIGGGILVAMMCSIDISDNIIRDNTSSDWGGGIYIAHMSSGSINGNIIENNEATTAGGIFIRRTDSVSITGNELTNNMARRNGGALYLDDRASAVIEENRFKNNLANNGGAVWVDNDSRAYIPSPDNNAYTNNEPNNIYRR